MKEEVTMNDLDKKRPCGPWYFTFGSDERFPFQNTYVIVFAGSEKEAVRKFRERYPDRTEGTVNCSFWYDWKEWTGLSLRMDGHPADVIGRDNSGNLSWDEIYFLAEDSACGSAPLKRKDTARGAVDDYAIARGYENPEGFECPEEEIERICNEDDLLFNMSGDIVSCNKTGNPSLCEHSINGICEYSPDNTPCEGEYNDWEECGYTGQSNKTPCDYPDQDGVHRCPYSDDPTGDCCRNYCGVGVDE